MEIWERIKRDKVYSVGILILIICLTLYSFNYFGIQFRADSGTPPSGGGGSTNPSTPPASCSSSPLTIGTGFNVGKFTVPSDITTARINTSCGQIIQNGQRIHENCFNPSVEGAILYHFTSAYAYYTLPCTLDAYGNCFLTNTITITAGQEIGIRTTNMNEVKWALYLYTYPYSCQSCTYPTTCSNTGTQTCTNADCSTYTQPCTRNTDNQVCEDGGMCFNGACFPSSSVLTQILQDSLNKLICNICYGNEACSGAVTNPYCIPK